MGLRYWNHYQSDTLGSSQQCVEACADDSGAHRQHIFSVYMFRVWRNVLGHDDARLLPLQELQRAVDARRADIFLLRFQRLMQ